MSEPRPTPHLPSFWRDAEGKIVIAQFPNSPLWIWLLATVIESMKIPSIPDGALSTVGLIAILVWAGLEIFQGVNGFRRCLGLAVAIAVIGNRLM